jgi:hypothetical protein
MGDVYTICDRYLVMAKSRPSALRIAEPFRDRASVLRIQRKRELELI